MKTPAVKRYSSTCEENTTVIRLFLAAFYGNLSTGTEKIDITQQTVDCGILSYFLIMLGEYVAKTQFLSDATVSEFSTNIFC